MKLQRLRVKFRSQSNTLRDQNRAIAYSLTYTFARFLEIVFQKQLSKSSREIVKSKELELKTKPSLEHILYFEIREPST